MATCVSSAPSRAPSTGNDPAFSTSSPTRRGLLAFAAGAAALTAPAALASSWTAIDWLDRWEKLGCGARIDRGGNMRLVPRAGVMSEAGLMLGELGVPDRAEQVREVLARFAALYAGRTTSFRRAVAASEAADLRFHHLPDDLEMTDPARHLAEENRMLAAYDAMVEAQPATWSEFVEKLARISDEGGCGVTEEAAGYLMRQARHLERVA